MEWTPYKERLLGWGESTVAELGWADLTRKLIIQLLREYLLLDELFHCTTNLNAAHHRPQISCLYWTI
jgi:hypothetical protein